MSTKDLSDPEHLGKRFDPFNHSYLADPYPFFAEARLATPVFYSPSLNYWVVTRYRDIRQIFETPELFSASNALAPLQPMCPEAQRILAEGGHRPVAVNVNLDPPGHTRVRRVSNVAFKPRRVAALAQFVRELAARFIDQHSADGRADLVRDLAWELPVLVIFRVLGIPDEDVPRIKTGSQSRNVLLWGHPPEEEQIRLAHGMAAFWKYAEELTAARAKEPRDDFTSDLLLARDGDQPALANQEVVSIVNALLSAAHETTTGLLGNAFRWLLTERHAWEEICHDPSLIPNAIEEVLRFDSSTITWRRKAMQAVEIGGVSVPADANLLLLIGSANRDPDVFKDPDRFDIHRPNADAHLSFGIGIHYCLGAPLARLEARVVLEELSTRLPSLRLVPGQMPQFRPVIAHRGPLSLLAEWDT